MAWLIHIESCAAGTTLTARLSSVNRRSLDETSCTVQTYFPRRENQEGNVRRVW